MPVEYSGITAEHMAVRTAAGLFDVSHMGEVEIAGKGALEAVQHITSNDASKLQVGQIQYSGLTTPEGHVRRRPAGLSLRAVALPAGHQRRQHRQGLRVDHGAREGSRARHRHRQLERSLRADRRPGAEGAGDPADADRDRSAGDQVLLVRARRDRRRPRHRVAHRLHRRRRLRSDGAAGDGRQGVGRAAAGGQAARLDPGRPRRARHAAPRSRDASLRQRHRRALHRDRSRPRLDRRLEQAGVPRPRRAARAEGQRHARRRWSASR